MLYTGMYIYNIYIYIYIYLYIYILYELMYIIMKTMCPGLSPNEPKDAQRMAHI